MKLAANFVGDGGVLSAHLLLANRRTRTFGTLAYLWYVAQLQPCYTTYQQYFIFE
jgi:hypothetical protein